MTANTAIRGVAAFPVTPMQPNGEIDHAQLAHLVEEVIAGGVHAIVPCGSVGEFAYLTREERFAVLETVLRVAGSRIPVVANVSAISTREACGFTEHATASGADALLMNQQSYFPLTEAQILMHVGSVASVADGRLGLYVYNQPLTGIDLSPKVVAEMHRRFGIAGIKEASGDLTRFSRIRSLTPETFHILSGHETLPHVTMMLGGSGWTSCLACIDARPFVRLYDLAAKADWAAAELAYRTLEPLCNFIHQHPLSAVMKAAMEIAGRPSGSPRAPLTTLSESLKMELADLLDTCLDGTDLMKGGVAHETAL